MPLAQLHGAHLLHLYHFTWYSWDCVPSQMSLYCLLKHSRWARVLCFLWSWEFAGTKQPSNAYHFLPYFRQLSVLSKANLREKSTCRLPAQGERTPYHNTATPQRALQNAQRSAVLAGPREASPVRVIRTARHLSRASTRAHFPAISLLGTMNN